MKHKLLIFFLFFTSLATVTIAQNTEKSKSISKVNSGLPNALKTNKIKAIIPPPLATAGSACKEESANNVTVVMAASGGSGDIIEWFGDQTSSTILHSGSIYSPSIGKTTTYYVWSHSGADYSIRVPVVASVFVAPPTVTLTISPSESPICEGTSATFTANGGADLFEFSVNGIVTQAMSGTKTYTTSMLKNSQTVSVRTRYGITLDGIVKEIAWGKGLAEDNVQAAFLSPGAANNYINGIKISSTEKELVFGLPGSLQNSGNILLFLDTKPSGFNVANFGDVASMSPTVRGFNFFNNKLSTFDTYFEADYCILIAKDDLGASYLSDVVELKTGNSIIGFPKPLMSVKEGNSGIDDYDNGFEVSVLKSLIGYNQGDIKFFVFTMQNDIVTNSFLSPERSSSLDYGNSSIDWNSKDPNPVVISANALIPCYKEASLVINVVEPPTTATVGPDQFNCTLNSSSLGGNSPTIGTGVWTLKSGPGAATFSDVTSGASSATVDTEGIYIFTWTITNGACPPSTADINIEFKKPIETPILSSVTQPTCSVATGGFSIANYNASYVYTSSPSVGVTISGNTVTAPAGTYTITAKLGACISVASVSNVVNAQPITPTQPTLSNVTQPTCSVATGSFTITNYNASYVYTSSPSVGVTISGNTVIAAAGSYTITATIGVCSSVASAINTVNVQPNTPEQPTLSSVIQPNCTVATGSFTITNYNVSYVYTSSPSVGVTISGNTVTAPAGTYTITAKLGACISVASVSNVVNAQPITPTQPTLSNVTQPTCSVATGSFTITNYNASYFYISSPSVGVTISGNTVTAPAGSYTITATLGVCTSVTSASKTVNTQSVTPLQPTLSSVTQPTCSVATGSFTITNYDASYIYTVSPSVDVSVSGNTVTAPAGTYTISAKLGACISVASVSNVVNAQLITPTQPTLSSVTQPTCSVVTGSFTITNYNTSYVYTSSPSVGVTISGNTVTAPAGSYTITATLGVCTSVTSASKTVNTQPVTPAQPTLSSVTQPTCSIATGSFTITNYDASYIYTVSPSVDVSVSGNTVTALAGTYTITVTLGLCQISTNTTVNAQPVTPEQPILSNVTQPTCSVATGSFTITNYNASYVYTSSPSVGVAISGNTVTAPAGSYTITATLGVCTSVTSASKTVNTQPFTPAQPTLSSVTQPTCGVAVGSFTITNYDASYTYSVNPSTGVLISGNTITALSGSYTVTTTLGLCATSATVTINPIPTQIQFEIVGDCINKEYLATASPLANSYDPNNVSYQWKDNSGSAVGTNSNILNISDVIVSSFAKEVFPLNYTLTIVSTATGCEATKAITVETIYCNIQKGISPDGNGSNDYFDLRLMDVRKLGIFNRYGIKVYEQSNYTDQWKGQSDKGENLPSATYYYVMELNKGETKTGWIYLIREK
jgi:gliding motility-associated-like protein